ncbi:hypothetical protein ANO11243_048940 [Dothideomycetidae sp. 11243]|nr:hypothetical protein ANO11243_048940 [fungal sp. No.11243]
MASKIIGMLDGLGTSLASKGQALMDSIFPPEKPFTLFAVGVALLILFPTIFFTTLTAVFLFLWGLGGYYLFKYFNKSTPPGATGDTIGDKLNSLTGNKLDFIMDHARGNWIQQQLGGDQSGKDAKEEKKASSPQNTPKKKANRTANDHKKTDSTDEDSASTTGADVKKRNDSPVSMKSGANGVKKVANPEHVTNGVKSGANGVSKVANPDHATDAVDNVTKTAGLGDHTDKVKGAPRKLAQAPGNVKGTVTGTLGGATGLT